MTEQALINEMYSDYRARCLKNPALAKLNKKNFVKEMIKKNVAGWREAYDRFAASGFSAETKPRLVLPNDSMSVLTDRDFNIAFKKYIKDKGFEKVLSESEMERMRRDFCVMIEATQNSKSFKDLIEAQRLNIKTKLN